MVNIRATTNFSDVCLLLCIYGEYCQVLQINLLMH